MRKCRRVCVIACALAVVCRLEHEWGMNEWPDYDFIVGEHGEAARTSTELTGWEDVRFELADEEPAPEA